MGGIKTTDGIAKEDCLSLPGQDTLCLIIAISTRKSKALRLCLVPVKYFPENICYFRERKIFSSVWLHSKKYFGKYFLVFGYILENALENPFYHVSHIFSASKQILISFLIK